MTPSQLASLLGRLGKGKKKTLSQAERQRRRDHLTKIRKLRWVKKGRAAR